MNKLKIKVNELGECKEFLLNEKKIGSGISKAELVIEAGRRAKLTLTMISDDIEIECDDVDKKIKLI